MMPHERHKNDFGYPTAKKPKLNLKVAPSASVESHQNDSLWGEDLPEDALDVCFELASQACSQFQHQTRQEDRSKVTAQITRTIDNTTKQKQNNGTTVKVSQKLAPSDIFNVPCSSNNTKDILPGKFRPKQWSNVNNKLALNGAVNVRSANASQSQHIAAASGKQHNLSISIPALSNSSFGPNHEQLNNKNELVEKIQRENAKLKEDFLAKAGEISILRQQLKQSDIKATSHLNVKMQEYEAKFRLMEKELEKAKTTVELQKLEAWKAKDKLLMVNQNATQNVPTVSTISHKSVRSDQFGGFSKISPIISYGELLLDVVTPHLFIKSPPEINLVELKTTFSLLDDTVDRKRTVFNPIHYTVENCWEPTMQLGLEESFDTVTAQCHMKRIFSEAYKILCCLLITLRERAEKETDYNLDSRDLQNARVKVDALDEPNLLSHRMWYTIERGVESRRVLGLVAEVSILSQFMADLVSGISQARNQSTVVQQCQAPNHVLSTNGDPPTVQPVFNDQCDKPSGCAVAVDSDVQPPYLHENQCPKKTSCIKAPEVKEEQNSKLEEVASFYQMQDYGFLKLIRDVTQIVASQNNSFEYSGFLMGVVKLLTNVQLNCSTGKNTNEFLSIFCVIVKTVIHSRPRMETTVTLAELVDSLSFNTEFMNSLCNFSQEKHGLDRRDGTGQNDRDMCALSMLCWLVERETDSSRTRTRLCRALVNWMTVGVKCRPFKGPNWTQCQKPSQADKCFCRTRMIESMVILIYKTFKDFEIFANTSRKESLRSVLVRGIMLLHHQIDSDPDFGLHIVDVEGYYQLLLMGLKNTKHNMLLEKHEGSALDELLAMEETITPPKFELTTSLEQHMDTIITTMELGWLEV